MIIAKSSQLRQLILGSLDEQSTSNMDNSSNEIKQSPKVWGSLEQFPTNIYNGEQFKLIICRLIAILF